MEKHHMHEHKEHEHHEVGNHHAMMEKDMRDRFFVCLLLTIPILLLSSSIQEWTGLKISFPFDNVILFLLASVVFIYGGLPFYRGAAEAIRKGTLDMMVLVSLAVTVGYLYSAGSTFFFKGGDFYWELSTLVVFMLFGHWMEMGAVRSAAGALTELVRLIPPKANLIRDGKVFVVDTEILRKGDLVLVRPGGKIPSDGVVIGGKSSVNESMVTGESRPVLKGKGSKVIGGTINGEGSLRVKITKIGKKTALAQIIELVREAQSSKPPVQKLADRAAYYLTIIAIVVGTITFAYWNFFALKGSLFAITLAITVIVIACPHALGLAMPIVSTVGITIGAKKGILVKNASALEISKKIDTIIFDKTGTLTKGEFGVTDVVSIGKLGKKEILSIAAGIESNSEHTIAKAIVKEAKERGIGPKSTHGFVSIPGKGAMARIGKKKFIIGNRALMEKYKIAIDPVFNQLASEGKTVVLLASNKLEGIIALSDVIRKESYATIRKLREMGIKTVMLTGDNEQVAKYVAGELSIDKYFYEVLPNEKWKIVKKLQREGKVVAMVGDGVNDAPALMQADAGIAIGAGTDVAIESADVVLVRNDPGDVVKLMSLSKATMRKMNENLFWATIYNVLAIPIAAGVLYPWGIILRPEFGALTMSASTLIVVANALLLDREIL